MILVLVEFSLWIVFDLLVVVITVVLFSTATFEAEAHHDADEC